jgi:hypothetical protein
MHAAEGLPFEVLPLKLYRHLVRQLLLHSVRLLNKRAEALTHHTLHAHREEPLDEAADAMAAVAGECDPARSVALDQDPQPASEKRTNTMKLNEYTMDNNACNEYAMITMKIIPYS